MSSPRPKVNPPSCPRCMSSAEVQQESEGGWYCRYWRCVNAQLADGGERKPIMVTSINKDEPVSAGLFSSLLSWLKRVSPEDRRPKHPRPPFPVGRPPRGGSGVLPAPREGYRPRRSGKGSPMNPPKRSGARPGTLRGKEAEPASPPYCPHCEVGKVEPLEHPESQRSFEIGRFRCLACKMNFTQEDAIAFAKAKSRDIDEAHSTGSESQREYRPRPPKKPTRDDDPEPRAEGDAGEMARAHRDQRHRQGGVPMNQGGEPIEADLRGGLRPNDKGAPTELSWTNHETKHESSAIWSAIKWIIGVGASIGLGWLAEWALF